MQERKFFLDVMEAVIMEKMGLNEIREKYLSFFESKGHLRLPSFSLVPQNDKSLLLINAGMTPMKPYFTGLQTPPRKRVTTCQKCVRTGDIDNVGKTARHLTFFEMLGNFSFGDYFKKEVIPWAWEFITKELKLPKDKLYVTIYIDDDEAFNLWTTLTDIDPSRIFRLGKEENFWEHGEGPCGPCSEIHFDRGEGKINNVEEFIKAGDEDRTIELWNLVFTQFDKDENGNYNKLKNPNIDTGMGLERMATIMQGTDSIYEVDTLRSLLDEVCRLAGKKYGINKKDDTSIRIITDHIRSVTFLICDGIQPSNEGRGYVLRRLLRRASRHGRLLGIKKEFLSDLCQNVIDTFGDAYPDLRIKKEYIKKVIGLEEDRFNETIDLGMDILLQYIKELTQNKSKVLSGEKAFKLYDTYGFPLELTDEILEEKGLSVDKDSFNQEMQKQRVRARAAREETNYMGIDNSIINELPKDINTIFNGYNNTETVSKVNLLIKEEQYVSELSEGETGIILTEQTPFYAEMGGQIGDTGKLTGNNSEAEIDDCKKNISGKILHYITVKKGIIKKDDEVKLEVNVARRNNICKNHTATHMLQAALKQVLGEHVHQSGSYVDDKRLRFDFTHFSSLTEEEIERVENIVNNRIMNVYKVNTDIMSLEDAKKSGAVALFDEKYKDEVRVVSVGDFSKELCGGTHVANSGQIGLFKIISETGVAAGIRRIEAVTGISALNFVNERSMLLKEASSILKCGEKEITSRITIQLTELKEKDKEIAELKSKLTGGLEDQLINNIQEIQGIKVISAALKDLDAESLRTLADKLRDKIEDGVVILGSATNNKVQLVTMATKNAVSKGIHCGKIIKEIASITGGGGGGRPDMAQAGGKDTSKLDQAINSTRRIIESLLSK